MRYFKYHILVSFEIGTGNAKAFVKQKQSIYLKIKGVKGITAENF